MQAIEKGTLQNLIFDNQAFANHRAMACCQIKVLKSNKSSAAPLGFSSLFLEVLNLTGNKQGSMV